MFAKIKSVGLLGLNSYMVDVEVSMSAGKYAVTIVGLPDTAVNEAKERVSAAMKNSGFEMSGSYHYTFNLAPADTKKEGSFYDLPIAISVLSATQQIRGDYKDAAFVGELSLSGEIKSIKGVLPMVIAAKEHGVKEIFVPFENCEEAAVIEDIKVYCTVDLDDLSPSLKKVVSGYYSKINKKEKLINKYDNSKGIYKAGVLLTESSEKLIPGPDGKIKGREVFDGVLIEFYIKYNDTVGVGDKVAFYSALKSIVGEVVDEGYEPYSEFRPDEEVSTLLGPSAILARMVPSALLVMFGNKVLIELKRKLQDIYEN